MSTSLYDMSVASYLQILSGTVAVMNKGREHCKEAGTSADEFVNISLYDDMLPFSFQIRSVVHHSLGAVKGLLAGEFTPPPEMPEMNYDELQALVESAQQELQAMTAADVDSAAGKTVMFRVASMDLEIPFTAENFILSFSLPNLNFHATTAYDLLRHKGVRLSKMDYLGTMRVGA